jgi:hypothetical protein
MQTCPRGDLCWTLPFAPDTNLAIVLINASAHSSNLREMFLEVLGAYAAESFR